MAGSGRFSHQRTVALLVLAATAAILPASAAAQTVSGSLIAAQPARSTDVGDAPAASKRENSWICASGIRLEVYPVSFDDPTTAPKYVVVYKRGDEVVASERIDARIARQLSAQGCGGLDMSRHDPSRSGAQPSRAPSPGSGR